VNNINNESELTRPDIAAHKSSFMEKLEASSVPLENHVPIQDRDASLTLKLLTVKY
jgi:hypothetical protein